MIFNFDDNQRVHFGAHTLQTTHGPALAAFDGLLYMVYVGDGGSNLWCATTDIGSADFKTWPINYQIKTAKRTPKSSYGPSLAVLDDVLHMVYQGASGSNIWWAWFDGKSWQGDVLILANAADCRPTLIADAPNHRLQIVYQDNAARPLQLVDPVTNTKTDEPALNWMVSAALDKQQMANWANVPWNAPAPIGYGAFPALAYGLPDPRSGSDVVELFVKHGDDDAVGASMAMGVLQGGAVALTEIANALGKPQTQGGQAGFVLHSKLHLFYRDTSDDIWDLLFDPTQGQAFVKEQVKCNGKAVTTSNLPGVVSNNNKVYLAYKGSGSGSHNLWFAWQK